MDTVKILIHDLKASISDEVLCDKLKGRLYMGGIQTQAPYSIKRENDTLVVTMGIIGTVVLAPIANCVTRYLKDPEKPEITFSSGSDVVRA